jgi:Tol biopolymer transport system component
VCDAANGRGGAWSPTGTIVFAPNPYSPIFKVSANGGVPEVATTFDATRGENSHRFPSFLPDGRHFVYAALPEVQANLLQISVASLDGPSGRRLLLGRTSPRYAAPGYLIFARDQAVVAQRIDLSTLTMVADNVPLADRPSVEGPFTGAPGVDCARDGTIVYDETDRRPTDLVFVGKDGRPIKTLLRHDGAVGSPVMSHSGDRLAMIGDSDGVGKLWMVDLTAGTEGRISLADQKLRGLAWTPDDAHIVANDDGTPGKPKLEAIDSRSGAGRGVFTQDNWLVPTSIAPDGTILLDELIPGRLYDIVYLPRGDGQKTRPYLATSSNETSAVISPDGRVVAYTSDASGRQEIYVDAFPDPTAARRVSTDGATGASWRADGREIYFTSGRTVYACAVNTQSSIEVGKPRILFELPNEIRGLASRPDGDGFYLLLPVGENPSSLTVVHNWAAQLEKRGD